MLGARDGKAPQLPTATHGLFDKPIRTLRDVIGNTLKGHRSKGAVEKAAPTVVVLVGNASFQELTASQIGPQLLLRVYQTAFTIVSRRSGYLLDTMAAGIVSTFRERAFDSGDGFLEVILKGVTSGPKEDQDNRLYKPRRRRRRK